VLQGLVWLTMIINVCVNKKETMESSCHVYSGLVFSCHMFGLACHNHFCLNGSMHSSCHNFKFDLDEHMNRALVKLVPESAIWVDEHMAK
jgi:hypothetical protein